MKMRMKQQRTFRTVIGMMLAGGAIALISSVANADTAVAWGYGYFGQLGNGANSDSNVPVNVIGLSTDVTAIAAGTQHGLAIQNGAAKAWGDNFIGQLGNGADTGSNVPVNVTGLSAGVTAVAAGTYHSLAIQDGAAKAWGASLYGRLGNGSWSDDSNVPVNVIGLSNGVTAVAAGSSYSLAIQNGAAKAWGEGEDGQLGNGSNTGSNVPVDVIGLSSGVTAVAAGTYHSLAIQNGNVYAWGYGGFGQLGNGAYTDSNLPLLVLDLADVDFVAIAAGSDSSYALTADGSLYAWGYNAYGQLGMGDNGFYSSPTLVPAPEGYLYTSISAGGFHAVATIAPIPEPASLSLLALGGVALLRRRRV